MKDAQEEYVVYKANPDYLPQILIYEIEAGKFDLLSEASAFAMSLTDKGEHCAIMKRFVCEQFVEAYNPKAK